MSKLLSPLVWLQNYLISPTHQWWVDNVWKPSWTRFVTALYGIPSALASIWLYLVNASQDNQVQQLMDKIHVPDWVPVGLAVIALIHYVAHGRD